MSSGNNGTGITIGIDLGTSFTRAAVFRNGEPEVIPLDNDGARKMSSYVAFSNNDKKNTGKEEVLLVGDAAKEQAEQNPSNTIFNARLLIGHAVYDPVVQADARYWPFRLVPAAGENSRRRPQFEISGSQNHQNYSPEQILGIQLARVKSQAEAFLQQNVTDAVLTVPATFSHGQRECLREAAAIAVRRFISDSTATALVYAREQRQPKSVFVFALGGGFLSLTLASINGDGLVEVLSTGGDQRLGGEDFDNRLIEQCRREFRRNHHRDVLKEDHLMVLPHLRRASEMAKCELSTGSSEAHIELELLNGTKLSTSITREIFEELCAKPFRNMLEPLEKVLRVARMDKKQVDEVVLVGGSTRIPRIRQLVAEFFPDKKELTFADEEAPVLGAALLAAILSDPPTTLRDLLLVDVTPLTLGVETAGGRMAPVVHRSSTIPLRGSRMFIPKVEGQRKVLVKVFEGEHETVKDNTLLGLFVLDGIPPSGSPQIEITFDIDAECSVHVSAQELPSGVKSGITITNELVHCSEEDIQKLVEEAIGSATTVGIRPAPTPVRIRRKRRTESSDGE